MLGITCHMKSSLLAKVGYFLIIMQDLSRKQNPLFFFLSLSTVMVQKRVDYNLSYYQDLSLEKIHYR